MQRLRNPLESPVRQQVPLPVYHRADGSIQVAPSPGQTRPHDADQWRWVVSAAHESNVAVAVAVALA